MDKGKLALRKLGQRIREFRQLKGWSQEEFALEAQLARSYLGDIERGKRNASFINIARIAGTLGVTIASLCEGVPAITHKNRPRAGEKLRYSDTVSIKRVAE